MSKYILTILFVFFASFLSACSTNSHHIGMWVDEDGIAPDTDQDGIKDPGDRCPSTPAGQAVDKHGCSYDNDQDGILNAIDQCPSTPIGTSVNAIGCNRDSDQDGVLNIVDQCPDTPLGTTVDRLGCAADTDGDGDGVINDHDSCPNSPPKAIVNNVGCQLDSDRDGVFDLQDRCPGTPFGTKVDCLGCSRHTLELPTLSGLHFDTDKDTLKPDSHRILYNIINTLQRFPGLKVKIVGHTDSRGDNAHNLDLSWRRARSAAHFLAQNGISSQRIQIEGKGEYQPAAENSTEEGRARNRRVEFIASD